MTSHKLETVSTSRKQICPVRAGHPTNVEPDFFQSSQSSPGTMDVNPSSRFLSTDSARPRTPLPRKVGFCKKSISRKLLKGWSGIPGSNRRRPAWKSQRRLIIKDVGVQGRGFRSMEFNSLRASSEQPPLIGVKMEWKIWWSEGPDEPDVSSFVAKKNVTHIGQSPYLGLWDRPQS